MSAVLQVMPQSMKCNRGLVDLHVYRPPRRMATTMRLNDTASSRGCIKDHSKLPRFNFEPAVLTVGGRIKPKEPTTPCHSCPDSGLRVSERDFRMHSLELGRFTACRRDVQPCVEPTSVMCIELSSCYHACSCLECCLSLYAIVDGLCVKAIIRVTRIMIHVLAFSISRSFCT
ncbi:hypothetical protein BJY04DRAFT_36171 [Aspergillus karnatakaensis]|uniref:uncharacterized protein n=1 Tax=Aspergillus karnatakaensis TaxID=1810916 RepID=UPI003CCD6E75